MTTRREFQQHEAEGLALRGKEPQAITTELNCQTCGQRLETTTYMDGPHIKILVDTRCRCHGRNA